MLSDELAGNMSNTESKPKDEEEEEENNNAVLPQIGEDPGLPADAIEQDSKARAIRITMQISLY
jgi:hypothetical protein